MARDRGVRGGAAVARRAVLNASPAPAQKMQQALILEAREKTGAKQGEGSAYHQVYYGRGRIRDQTPPIDRLRPIDLAGALEYTLDLGLADPSYESKEYAWIVFYNQQTLESFDALRTHPDTWQLSMPSYESDTTVCNTHYSWANREEVQAIITKFFEGGDWRGVKGFVFDHDVFSMNVKLFGRQQQQ